MNKRKTLRMTSILLALMMFFGMVSVLLVPAGVAGAADAQVDVVIDETTTNDSDNIIILDDKTYTLKVSKLLWGNDNSDIVDIKMTLKDYAGKVVSGYDEVTMKASTTEAGMYIITFKADKAKYSISTPGQTGLYTMDLRRHYANNKMDETPITVGAFWLAQQYDPANADGSITDESATAKLAVNNGTLYVGPEAKIQYDLSTEAAGTNAINDVWNTTTGEFRIVDPIKKAGFIKTFADLKKLTATNSQYIYNVPKTATHDQKLSFFGLAIETTYLACYAVDFNYEDTAGAPDYYNTGKIDAKGPAVTDILITNMDDTQTASADGLLGFIADGIMFADNFGPSSIPYTVEAKDISDDDSGPSTTDPIARFTSVYSSSVKFEIGMPTTKSDKYYNDEDNSYMSDDIDFTAAASGSGLVNGIWKLEVIAEDGVGNKSVTSYGNVKVYDEYIAISDARVEAQNAIQMYVGQVLTKEEILAMNVKVYTNTDATAASFPDRWYWMVNAADSYYLDYDPVAGTITAKNAGEGRLTVQPLAYWLQENLAIISSTTGKYLRVVITDQPTVTSLTLNNTTMTIDEGQTQKLTATAVPSAVAVTWETSDSSIATVASDGTVTGVKAGTAVIFAKAGHLTKSCVVTVKSTTIVDPDPPAEDLKGWVDENNNRYYYVDNQKVVGWRKIDGSWYFFDYSTAAMRANGWLKEGGKWYYLNSNGTMKSAEWFKDNNGKWYWLKANGAMAAGWEKINGTWYYFNASGAMQTGWVNVRGIWYYMKSSGAMAEGWLQDGGSWYYLTPGGGAMVTGRVTINGRASNFATSGRWLGYV